MKRNQEYFKGCLIGGTIGDALFSRNTNSVQSNKCLNAILCLFIRTDDFELNNAHPFRTEDEERWFNCG